MLPVPHGLIDVGLIIRPARDAAASLSGTHATPCRSAATPAAVDEAAPFVAPAALVESDAAPPAVSAGAAVVSAVPAPDATLSVGAVGLVGGGDAAPADACSVSLGAVAALAESLGAIAVSAGGAGVAVGAAMPASAEAVESGGVTVAAAAVLSRTALSAVAGSDVAIVSDACGRVAERADESGAAFALPWPFALARSLSSSRPFAWAFMLRLGAAPEGLLLGEAAFVLLGPAFPLAVESDGVAAAVGAVLLL